jgi:hypothetical protein
MRRSLMLIGVIVVVGGFIGYWSLVGFASSVPDADDNVPVPDSNGDGIPDENVPPDYHYYATFKIDLHIISQEGIFELEKYVGKIDNVAPNVERFLSMEQGRVFESEKLLKGGGGTFYGDYWVHMEVTGPENYVAHWTSDGASIIAHTALDPQYGTVDTGRFLMEKSGSYSVTIILKCRNNIDNISYDLDRITQALEVQ